MHVLGIEEFCSFKFSASWVFNTDRPHFPHCPLPVSIRDGEQVVASTWLQAPFFLKKTVLMELNKNLETWLTVT